jgi:chromosome segregation ATPase
MQKELNPDLFGESSVTKSRVVAPANPASALPFEQVVQVDQKLAEMRSQVVAVADQMNRMVAQVNEFMKATQMKFDKIQAILGQLEKNDAALSLDNTQKLSQLNHKLGERKILDMKVQEMIDRHNTVLKSYELRLSQLQKLIAEREQQVMAATASLNEAKMEIARMKRL